MTSPVSEGLRGYREVLRNREFLALTAAHTLSLLGTTIATVALAVLVFQRTGSPALSALTFTFGFTPYLLGGLLSPRLEHVPPRRLMVGCEAFQALVYAVMAVPGLPVWALLALLALGSITGPVFGGTRAALLPELLGDGNGFVLGRSVLRLLSQTSQIIGLALGGALLLLVAPHAALLVVAATCAGSALLIRLGVGRRAASPKATDAGHTGRLRVVFADRRRRRLLLFSWLVPLAAVAPEALAVPYVVVLGLPAGSAGLLLWAAPFGAVIGELLTVRLLGTAARNRAVLPLATLVLTVPLGFALRPSLPYAALLLLVSSAGFGYTLGLDHQLLDATPPELHRRVLSVATSGLMFWQGLGFGLAGAAGQVLPIAVAIPAISLAGLVGLALLARGARRSRAARPRPGRPDPAQRLAGDSAGAHVDEA